MFKVNFTDSVMLALSFVGELINGNTSRMVTFFEEKAREQHYFGAKKRHLQQKKDFLKIVAELRSMKIMEISATNPKPIHHGYGEQEREITFKFQNNQWVKLDMVYDDERLPRLSVSSWRIRRIWSYTTGNNQRTRVLVIA